MCLAIPGKIESIDMESVPRMAKVNFGGIIKNICVEFMPDAKVDEYVLVHVGLAISKVDEKDALESLELFQKMGDALDELKTDEPQ